MKPTLIACLGLILIIAGVTRDQRASSAGDAVILITLDGARTEEIFAGLDRDILQSTLRSNQKIEEQPVYRRFWADTPVARREKLMPFFWRTLMAEHGSIAGNVAAGSAATLTNRHRVSYPGYSEILLGEAHDDVIKNNDPIRIPYPTVFEELRPKLGLTPPQAAVFTSWNVFDAIATHTPGNITVNAGPVPVDAPDPETQMLSRMQLLTPTPWDGVRHDAYTFLLAMAHLETARARLLYIAFDETDDWAHDGRYDRVLEAYARTDGFLQQLWTWIQSHPDYKDRTHLLITTDHGRGHRAKDWRNHGARVEGAQNVWMAFVSPSMSARGEWRDRPAVHTNQVAATIASWLGVDWVALRPQAGQPIR
jgi:hypothetical protein